MLSRWGAGGLLLTCALLLGCSTPTPPPPTVTLTPTAPIVTPAPTPTPPLLALPQGFTPVPPSTYGLTADELAQPGLTIEQIAAYEGPQGAVVFAFWGQVTRGADAASQLVDDPTQLAEAFLAGYAPQGEQPEPLALSRLGEQASGFTLPGDPTVTVIAFERGPTVAVLVGLAPPDIPLDLAEVARTLDDRLSSP